jgi:hypothetical protein
MWSTDRHGIGSLRRQITTKRGGGRFLTSQQCDTGGRSEKHKVAATAILCFKSQLFEKVCELDPEGIVAKRKTAIYRATEKPAPYWIKIKNPHYSQAEGRDELLNAVESTLLA